MHYLNSVQASCETSASQLCTGACAYATAVGVKVQACGSGCNNSTSSSCVSEGSTEISFSGGDKKYSDQLLQNPKDPNIFRMWLDSVNITTGLGDFGGFVSLDIILRDNGLLNRKLKIANFWL